MGIKIFYILAVVYAVISSIGILKSTLPGHFAYIFLIINALYFLYYINLRKIYLYHSMIAAVIVNASVQLTGGINSLLFYAYPVALAVLVYKERFMHYWIIALFMLGAELLSALFNHELTVVPFILFAAAIGLYAFIRQKFIENEAYLKKSLIKYEARDEFFRPDDFEHQTVTTSIKEIDRHELVERPLLYFIKFLHDMFDAHTVAFFAQNEDNLALIQGFSRSELFRPGSIVSLQQGIYRQITASRRSILIKEYSQNPEELGYYRGELKIASVMIAPIVLLEKIEGVLVIDRKTEPFDDKHKILFDEAVKTAGFLLAMLRLYEDQRYKSSYLHATVEFAKRLHRGLDLDKILPNALDSFKEVLKCNDVSIAEIDELNERGTVIKSTYIKENTEFSLDDGLVGFIARHRNYIIKEDLGKGNLVVFKKKEKSRNLSFIGVPILQGDNLLGVLWCEDHKRKKFSEDDVEPVNLLASHLSLVWQRAIHHKQEKEKAALDGLTGLYNHRQFHEVLQKEIDDKKEVVLLMFDIDHFKDVNDTYGHQGGDKVLKFLANLISHTGIAARYGGEEFAIVLPKLSLKKGIDRAVRIRAHVEKSIIKVNNKDVKITVSIGVAHYPTDAQTREDLIEKADKALYQAKQTGRNKVVVAHILNRNGQDSGKG